MPPDETRVVAIETALAHLEAELEDLSAVVRAQADRIDRLERGLAQAAARLEELEAGAPPSADARPPHW